MKSTFKPFLAVLISLSFLIQTASAQINCAIVHIPESSKRVRTTDGLIRIEDAAGTAELLAKGQVNFDPRPLSNTTKKALVELIHLATWTRATKISENLILGKDKGELTLGFDLKDGYSLEVVYTSDFRYKDEYQNPKVYLITKGGGSKDGISITNVNGSFRLEKSVELESFFDIADKNFQVSLPARISGDVVTELISILPALDLFQGKAKFDLRKITENDNYTSFKFNLMKKMFLTKVRAYLDKGFYKQIPKVIYPIFGLVTLWGAVHFFPVESMATKDWFANQLTVKPVDWAIESMNQFSTKENLPANIKNQIEDISRDLTLYKSNAPNGITAAPKAVVNLNLPGKFVINNQQYMWVENVFNSKTNSTDTILFITQDNRYGNITSFMGKIDTQKYSELISFLRSRGQINTAEPGK